MRNNLKRSFLTNNFLLLASVPSLLRTPRFRRDPRQLEEEEEIWFNSEDDDAEDNGADGVATSHSATGAQQVQSATLTTSPTSPIASSKSNVISPKANHSGGSSSPIVGASSNGGSSSPSTLSPSTSPVPPSTDVQSPSTLKKVQVF